FKLPRGQQCRRASLASLLGRDGVEVGPAVGLPRKDDAVVGAPEELIGRLDAAEGTADSRAGLPHLPALAVGDRGDADGPGLGGRLRPEGMHEVSRGGDAEEGHLPAVRRPGRVVVAVDARVEPAEGLVRPPVYADEAVVAPVADE